MSPGRRVTAWLSDRTGFGRARAVLQERRLPRRGVMFYLGSATLFLLLLQVGSGILLLVHYRPDAAHAYQSVEEIAGSIPYGELFRGVHLFSGDLFVGFLLAHMFVVVSRRSFKPPHELSWLTGLVALAAGIGLAFTGVVLPWSRSSVAEARTGSEIARYVPWIGEWLRSFMRGGEDVTPNTLAHAFGFHVAVLPGALTAILALHLASVARKPPSAPLDPRASIPFYPDFIIRQAAVWTGLLVVVMTLAIFVDRPLGPAAQGWSPASEADRPPWYFLPAHEVVRSAPAELLGVEGPRFLVGAACVLLLGVVALPFLDPRGAKLTAWLGWGVLFLLILLGALARF